MHVLGPAASHKPSVPLVQKLLHQQDLLLHGNNTMFAICWQVVYSDALNTDKPKAAAMLMTSATVHAGTSGGAVVADDGSIAGLVTSNARFAASGAIIPNLNFVIAAETLKPIWALAQHPDGLTHDALQALDVQDAALASLWKLTAPPKKEGPGSMGGTRGKAIASDRLADLLSKAGLSKALMQPDELKLPGKVESKL